MLFIMNWCVLEIIDNVTHFHLYVIVTSSLPVNNEIWLQWTKMEYYLFISINFNYVPFINNLYSHT